jgi:hypothetical protein
MMSRNALTKNCHINTMSRQIGNEAKKQKQRTTIGDGPDGPRAMDSFSIGLPTFHGWRKQDCRPLGKPRPGPWADISPWMVMSKRMA